MLIYNLNLIIVYITCFLSRICKRNKYTKLASHLFITIAFFSMIIVAGGRYNVGTDYSSYEQIFKSINYMNKESSIIEIGYYFLNKIVYRINSNPQSIFFVTSIIIIFLIFITIYKNCERYELGIYLFITMFHFYTSFNVIRQYIAIAITFYAIKYIFEKNFLKYLISIIIAATFHITAIIMIPTYFIVKRDMNGKDYFYGMVIGIVSLLGFESLFNIMISLFPKYELYSNSIFFTYGSSKEFIIYITIFIIMYIYRKPLIKRDIKNKVYINFTFIATIVSILTIKGVLFARIAGFFNIYALILIPNFLSIFNKKERTLLYYTIMCIGYLYCYLMLKSNQGNVLPYRFINI